MGVTIIRAFKGFQKITVVLLITIAFCTQMANSQDIIPDTTITFSSKAIALPAMLDTLSTRYGLFFSYNSALAHQGKTVPIAMTEVNLTSAFKYILRLYNIDYIPVDGQIVLFGKENNSSEQELFKNGEQSTRTIAGKITDLRKKKPIEYANISLKNRLYGTISNAEGEFTINIPEAYLNDTMVISSMGYSTMQVYVPYVGSTINVSLKQQTLYIKEVTIKSIDPLALIEKVNESITTNYCNDFTGNIAYYREVSKKENEYIQFNEAIVQVNKTPYRTKKGYDLVKVFKARKKHLETNDTINYKLQGGIHNSLQLDVIKHTAGFLNPEFFHLYKYWYEGMIIDDNKTLYIISFDQKQGVHEPLYQGKLFINSANYALEKAEFSLSPVGMKYAKKTLVVKSSFGIKAIPVNASYLVNYENNAGIYYLKNMRTELTTRVRQKKIFKSNLYNSVIEMVFIESIPISPKNYKIKNVVKSNEVFTDQNYSYDPGFWEKYNTILPEEALEKSIEKIKDKIPSAANFY